jgi:Tol biopolymer transport system component
LYFLEVATGERRRLTRPPAGSIGDAFPRFSPDWEQVAFLRQGPSRIYEIWVVDANGARRERPITADGYPIAGLGWSGDGQHLLYVSARGGPDPAVWRLAADGGRPELLTVLPAYSRNLALSAETGAMAFTKCEVRSSIWRHDATGSGREPERLIRSSGVQAMPRYSPDGRSIAFMSDRAGGLELWVSDEEGNNARRLTDLGGEGGAPRWSPDGKWIAFDVRTGGQHRVLTVAAGGGAVVELIGDRFENGAPSWSEDGAWVYFGSNRSGKAQIWRVPVRGGEPEQITWNGGMLAYEAPGGKEVYYAGPREKPGIFKTRLGAKNEEVVMEGYRFGYLGMWQLMGAGVCYLELEEGRDGVHPVLRLKPYGEATARTLAVLPPRATPRGNAGGLTVWHPFSVSPEGRSVLMTQLDQGLSTIMVGERPRN